MESYQPQTGIYYWGPVGDKWRIYAFFDIEHPNALHAEIWRDYAATIMGLYQPQSSLPKQVLDAYLGLPRGRISRHGSGFAIEHNNDVPTLSKDDMFTRVRERFILPIETRSIVTHHESMDPTQVKLIQSFIGRDLGLLEFAEK